MRYLMAAHTDVGIKKRQIRILHDKRSTEQNSEEYFSVFYVMVWADWQTEN